MTSAQQQALTSTAIEALAGGDIEALRKACLKLAAPDPDKVEAYQERKAARVERYKGYAGNARTRSTQRFETARKATAGIPMGQPILVDHYSAPRHRAALKKSDTNMRKGIEEQKKAKYWERRIEAAESNHAIRSDDPEAIVKLVERITELEAVQAHFKAANKIVRSKKLTDDQKVEQLVAMGISESRARVLLEPDFAGRLGYPSYRLTNNNGNIRRLKKRLETLQAQNARPAGDTAIGDVVITENEERQSVEVRFPGIPSEEVRNHLKQNGFRWARKSKCWYRKGRQDWIVNIAKKAAEMHAPVGAQEG